MFCQANGIKVQNQCGHLTMDGYVCWKSKKEGGFHQTATLGNMTESGYYTVQKSTVERSTAEKKHSREKHTGEKHSGEKLSGEKAQWRKNTAIWQKATTTEQTLQGLQMPHQVVYLWFVFSYRYRSTNIIFIICVASLSRVSHKYDFKAVLDKKDLQWIYPSLKR